MVGRPTEQATLIVNGRNYTEWKTVQVKHNIRGNPMYTARFTCSEAMPLAKNLDALRIKPNDVCTILLAGFGAFRGKVVTRQVYFDANNHHVEIQCSTIVDFNNASVISKTGEWINKTFEQIAREVLDKVGVKLIIEGGSLPAIKFPRVNAAPGESIFGFLDTLARSLAASGGLGIGFTSNENGDFVVVVGPSGGSDTLVEGENILIGREILFSSSAGSSIILYSQGPGTDQKNGAAVAHQPYYSKKETTPFTKGVPPNITHSDIPTSSTDVLKGRADNESAWSGEDEMTVEATVYGWLRPSGGLWRRNQTVNVKSPSLLMKGEPLRAKTVTFTQDDRTGTRTTLELCNATALREGTPEIK